MVNISATAKSLTLYPFSFFFFSGAPAFNGLVPKINSVCSWQRPPAWHRISTFASVSEKLFTISVRSLEPLWPHIGLNQCKWQMLLFTAKYKSLWRTLECYLIFNIYFFLINHSRTLKGLLKNVKRLIWSRFVYYLLPTVCHLFR